MIAGQFPSGWFSRTETALRLLYGRHALRHSRAFKVDIPERALIDLDERLRRWRPPIAIADNGSWASGTDPDFLARAGRLLAHGYDWQRCQEAINRWPNYLVDIGAQRLHFIREPGTRSRAHRVRLPLVVTHGWPGSIVEFLHIIDALAHPEDHGGDPLDAFDVIVPSLPGTASPARRSATTAAPAQSARAPSRACGTGSCTKR